MADLDNQLDQIAVAQAQPAVLANELFDALSPAACYGRRARTCSGLVWGYYGGRFNGVAVAHGSVTATASLTNYVVAHRTTGVVSISTSITNWNDTGTYERLYLLTANATDIIDWDDHRQIVTSQFTSEYFQDLFATLLTPGSGISIVYDDALNTLTISASGGSSEEAVQDIVGALVVAGQHIDVTYNDADSPATLVISNTRPGMTQEEVENLIASLLQAGSGISLQYNGGDSPASLVITSTGADTGFIQDVVGALVVPGPGISVAYDNVSSPRTLTITNTQQPGQTQEQIEDMVAALLVAGTNVSLVYDDAASPAKVTINATAGAGSGGAEFYISETDPAGSPSPANGARWLKLSTGIEYTWVTGAWVQLD
jgi:hypothetical protein